MATKRHFENELFHKLTSERDGRSSTRNCRRIIKSLRELGVKDGEPILHKDIAYIISNELGFCTWRSEKNYIERLIALQYLKPLGKRQRSLTSKIPTSKGYRNYFRKGFWNAYIFGLKAPRKYEETLNPKYVPPPQAPPFKQRESVETQKETKTICTLCDEVAGCEEADGRNDKRREEREARSTHIVSPNVRRLTPESNKADLGTFQQTKTEQSSLETVRRQTDEEVVNLIDYDIPKNPTSENRAFYRKLSKLKQSYGFQGKSSDSVLMTADRELAVKIYDLARSYGEATLWRATRER